jgi:uncharacterized protein YcbK (DUF882 family)
LLVSVLLASCSATGSPELELASPSFTGSPDGAPAIAGGETSTEAYAGGDLSLPENVASLPMLKPESGAAAAVTAEASADQAVASADTAAGAGEKPENLAPAARKKGFLAAFFGTSQAATPNPVSEKPEPGQKLAGAETEEKPVATADDTAAPAPSEEQTASAKPAASEGPVLEHGGAVLTAGVMPEAPAVPPKKRGFLAALFGTSPAAAAPDPVGEQPESEQKLAKADPEKKLAARSREPAGTPVRLASLGGEQSGEFVLPGVRQSALFEIKRRSGLDDDSDVDLHEEAAPPVELAFAPGLARTAPNGLLKQRENVDVGCLKPDLVRLLKTIERHYGRKLVVTSGYRSPSHNRRVNGAKRSMHMYCAAADVQVPGVSKWELARLVRSMPGRGGVGTYCHTESVHIDVGPERDWNWRCRRRKA